MEEGRLNLQVLAKQDNFNDWLFSAIKPFIFGRILEVGCGEGTISRRLIIDFPRNKICLSDVDGQYLAQLKINFSGQNIQVRKLDLCSAADFDSFGQEKFDTVVCSNVLEHIPDELFTLEKIYGLLRPAGKLILVVPQYPRLFNKLDEAAGHVRRYGQNELIDKALNVGFTIEKLESFNAAGLMGWFLNGTLFQSRKLSQTAFTAFNALVPIIKFIEKNIFGRRFGLSIIAVLKK